MTTLRIRTFAFVLTASLLCLSCGDDGSGGGGGGGGDTTVRIGRGAPEPVGSVVTVELQEGVAAYAGAVDYTTGGGTAADLLEMEIDASGTILNRAYIRFDLAPAGIPAGATVTDARLELTVYRENGGGHATDVLEAWRLTEAWTGSGDRAYLSPPSAADGVAPVIAYPDGSGGDPNVLTPPQILSLPLSCALVEGWIAASASNDGVALVPSVSGNGMQLHVFAGTESTPEYRPKLVVEYAADANQPPTASVTADVTTGNAPLVVVFTGSGTDPDGAIAAWRYDFDDGAVAFTRDATHTYERPGTYFVNFTVGDDGGRTDTDIVVVTVTEGAPATYPAIGYHPPGGEPDASTETCAPGMARPLPSSRRDVLVWPDQVEFSTTLDVGQAVFLARRTVGTQKINKTHIDAVRAHGPTWRVLQYHLAYGLTRSGDWTAVNSYGPEKDAFDAWLSARGYGAAQIAGLIINSNLSTYLSSDDTPDWDVSYATPGLFDGALRYAADFYYCDIAYDPGGGSLWHRYITDETIRRMEMNGAGSECDGTFFDTSSLPGPNLGGWCGGEAYRWYNVSDICAIATQDEYQTWWNARAKQYYAVVRGAYANGAFGRYIVLPNSNQMLTGWAAPEYLTETDGAFVESFGTNGATQTLASRGAGEFETSAGRILTYITGAGKVLLAAPDCDAAAVDVRRFCVAQYFLLKNDTSYYELNAGGLSGPPNGDPGNPKWFPEYEIDLGCYLDDAPASLDDLRVAGTASGGLYARWYSGGLVLVNSSLTTTFEFELDRAYYPVTFSGGGYIERDGSLAAQSLTTGAAVSGTLSVAANSVAILRAAALP